MAPRSALRGRRGDGRRGRVAWADAPAPPADAEEGVFAFEWRCDPERFPVFAALREPLGEQDGGPAAAGGQCGSGGEVASAPAVEAAALGGGGSRREAVPEAMLRIRSAEGDLFEAPAATLWHSVVARELVEESGPDQEIPLPRATTRALSVVLAWSTDVGQDLGALLPAAAKYEVLAEVVWVARLLDFQMPLSRSLSRLIDKACDASELLDSIPLEFRILMVQESVMFCSPCATCLVLERLVDAWTDPVHLPIITKAVTPYLGHRCEEVRKAAAAVLKGMPAWEAQLVLLTHKDFRLRGVAVHTLATIPKHPEFVPAVAKFACSSVFEMREAVAQALASASPRGDPLAMDTLGVLLADPVREVRGAAARGMRQVALPDDPRAISIAMACVMHDDWPIKCTGLQTLADVAPSHHDLVADLAERLRRGGATLAKITAAKLLDEITSSSRADGMEQFGFDFRRPSGREQSSWASDSEGEE